MQQRPGIRSRFACWADTAGVEMRIAVLSFMAWWSALKMRWTLGSRKTPQLALLA